MRKVSFDMPSGNSSTRSRGQGSISKKNEREIKNFLVSELNRQEQIKEISKSNAKFQQRQAETERLRQIKIAIVDKKRKKASEKKQKQIDEFETKSYREGYKARVKEILKKQKEEVSWDKFLCSNCLKS